MAIILFMLRGVVPRMQVIHVFSQCYEGLCPCWMIHWGFFSFCMLRGLVSKLKVTHRNDILRGVATYVCSSRAFVSVAHRLFT